MEIGRSAALRIVAHLHEGSKRNLRRPFADKYESEPNYRMFPKYNLVGSPQDEGEAVILWPQPKEVSDAGDRIWKFLLVRGPQRKER
jgi:hypothetical protein